MRNFTVAAGLLVCLLCTTANATDYLLDVSRLDAIQGKLRSLRTESIELRIKADVDFHTRVRIRDEVITVKGRLSEEKSGKLFLRISVQYLSDVADPDVLTGGENETSCSTSIGIVPGLAVPVGSSVISSDGLTRHRLIVGSLDRFSIDKKTDVVRRKRIKRQYQTLIRNETKAAKTMR